MDIKRRLLLFASENITSKKIKDTAYLTTIWYFAADILKL